MRLTGWTPQQIADVDALTIAWLLAIDGARIEAEIEAQQEAERRNR